MNNLLVGFNQIMEFAAKMNVPLNKKRGILREYLQVKFLSLLYGFNNSRYLSFVGGTSIRLLRDADRFSEDLDFDNLGISDQEIKIMVNNVVEKFNKEDIKSELYIKFKGKNYFELRFPSLLYELKISTNPYEKLMIKIDYADYWHGQLTETILMSKYGIIENVITNNINQLLVQKLTAYVQRNKTQPRDVYDVIWLFTQGAKFDREFARVNRLQNIAQKAWQKLKKEGVSKTLSNRLRPYLFKEENIKKLSLFESVLEKLVGDRHT